MNKKVYASYDYMDVDARILIQRLKDINYIPNIEIVDSNAFDRIGDESIAAIKDDINSCNIFLCFIKRESPNVMFELGYAHGRNRRIIIIGDSKDMPSFVQNMIYLKPNTSPYGIMQHIENILIASNEEAIYVENKLQSPLSFIDEICANSDLIDNLDGKYFEDIIRNWFIKKGYKIASTTPNRDSGYDFMIEPFREKSAVVEVKKYKTTSQVSVSVIRQLVGAMYLQEIKNGIMISSASFTNSAKYFIRNIVPSVFLWTIHDLKEMKELDKYEIERRMVDK